MVNILAKRRDELVTEIKGTLDQYGNNLPDDVYGTLMEKKEELDDVAQKIKAGEEKAANLAALNSLDFSEETSSRVAAAKSLGEHFVKNASPEDMKRVGNELHQKHQFSVPEYGEKAASDPASTGNLTQEFQDGFGTTWNRSIVNQRRERLVAADLMGSATVSTSTIKYLVEKVNRLLEGAPAVVAEGTKKPYVRFDTFDIITETLAKLAALTKLTDEMIEDYAFVADYINTQLVYELSVVEEQQLLNGNGVGNNLTGLLQRSGIQTHNIAGDTAAQFDGLFQAMQKVPAATNLVADGLMLNPLDYITLRLAKDGNGQYIAGGPFQGQYGQGGVLVNPPVWGLRTIDTNAVPQGTYALGAFRQGATVLRKGGVRVDATNLNGTDFEDNLVTLRAEERLGLMVPLPAAFVTGTIGAEVTP